MNHITKTVILTLLVTSTVCALSLAQIQATAQIQVTPKSSTLNQLRFLAAGIENAKQNLKCFHANVLYFEQSPESVDEKAQVVRQKVEWFIQEDRLHAQVQLFQDNSETVYARKTLVSNGERAMFLGEQGGHYEGAIAPTEDYISNGYWKEQMFSDPRYYAYQARRPLDDLFNTLLTPKLLEEFSVTVGEELLDSSHCTKVEITAKNGKSKRILWIEPDRGFLLRRFEMYFNVNGTLVLYQSKETSALVVDQGMWLPTKAEERYYEGILDGNLTAPPLVRRITITNFTAACGIPDKVFDLEWPVGTVVTDAFNNTVTTVQTSKARQSEQQPQSKGIPSENPKN